MIGMGHPSVERGASMLEPGTTRRKQGMPGSSGGIQSIANNPALALNMMGPDPSSAPGCAAELDMNTPAVEAY